MSTRRISKACYLENENEVVSTAVTGGLKYKKMGRKKSKQNKESLEITRKIMQNPPDSKKRKKKKALQVCINSNSKKYIFIIHANILI